jgi:tripartite-type tricarboxylate transporter receptor subunit TctC
LILNSFNVVCAPVGTPVPIQQKLNRAINKFTSDPAIIKLQRANGIEPVTDSTPESATNYVNRQIEELTPLIKAAQRGRKRS